jgi:uncharacterized protein YcgI (DUF1989 family)
MIDLRKFVIAAQTGRSFQVARGEYIRVIDPEGQQVADLWALTTDGEIDWLSTSQTRDITERLFPSIGESFYSYNAKPMLTLVEDESSGPHDMLFPACNHDLYVRAGLHEHPNCRDNLFTALRNENIRLPVVPDPVNFFQNSPPKPDGRLDVLASLNLPGGYVVLRAEQDLTLVITACSIDFHPTNGGICTPIEIEISQTPFSVVP